MAKTDKKTAAGVKEHDFSTIKGKFKASPGIYIGSIAVLVLVTVTFIGGDALAGGFGSGGGDLTFGYYDKVPISWVSGNALSVNYYQLIRQYQAQNYELNYGDEMQIMRMAFERAVLHTAVLQMMKRSNFSISDKAVDRLVAMHPDFQDGGRFSSVLWNRMSESSRLAIWREIHDELIKSAYYSDFFYGMLIPSGEAEFIGKMTSKMRTFDMVSFNVDNYPEAEYLSFANENAELFQSIHMSKLTISSSEREAKKILESIKNGTISFEDAARAQSQDNFKDRGGDMGSRYYFEFDIEIPNSADRDVILKLSKGEMSNVIKVNDQWVFFRVEEALQSADFNDDRTMERVRLYVRNYDRGLMEDWAIAQANDFIIEAKEVDFSNAARWWNLTKSTFGPLPINYGGVELFTPLEAFSIPGFNEQALKSLSANENFWKIAFSTPINVPSEPFVHGNYVVVLLPTEQTEDDEIWKYTSEIYSSDWLNRVTDTSLQYYFLSNPRMDDRFYDVYLKNIKP